MAFIESAETAIFTYMNYLDELNDAQRAAVMHTEGPVMVIAGPGSGKTRVLTYRIAYLIEKGGLPKVTEDGELILDELGEPIRRGVDAFSILALTFTNKAAKEMRERIHKIIGGEAKNIWMGTFHSIFARILRVEHDKIGYPSNFTIYDTDDSKSVIRQLVKELELNDKLYKPNVVFNRISNAKNNLISPAAYQKDVNIMSDDAQSGRPKLGLLYEMYAKRCFQSGAMDFDDLLFKMYELLATHPEVLHKYQHKFQYILVDEYQDTNFAQYLITKKLAAVHENICVVGDDAQSIYSFRGADIQNILNFQKDYPDMRVFKLEQNYRSTNHIVNAANEIITKNKLQLPKKIWTSNGDGEKIKVVKALSDNDEGRIVADSIFEYKMREHYRNDDFAILYRTNAQSRSFEEALRRNNIAYKVYGGLSFYQRKEIKDMLAYLKLTVNHYDEEALRRIINYPGRGIGDSTIEKATVIASQQGKRLWNILETIEFYPSIQTRTQHLIIDFVQMIKSFATMLTTHKAFDLASHIARSSRLLKELYDDKTVEGISRYENLQELLNGIKEFSERDEVAEGENTIDLSLGAYLQDIMLLTDQDDNKGEVDQVKLMTIHAAKGLEFQCVYAVGLEEGLFPSMMSVNSREDLEEERRLFYVAVTRAKGHLTISYALQRYRFGQLTYCEPSRFIDELNPANIEFLGHRSKANNFVEKPFMREEFSKTFTPRPSQRTVVSDYVPSPGFKADDPSLLQAGMEIEHQKFGMGKIISIEGAKDNRIATLSFEGMGEKRIMLKYAKIRIVNSGALN
ncbi:MAG: 3'-5' exonuclease [Chitinophagales bacterium]|nr:3'-5' exonuclease [Chitinophagales bacterium]